MHVLVEERGQLQVLSHCSFRTRTSLWDVGLAGWPVSPWGLLVSLSPGLGLQAHTTIPSCCLELWFWVFEIGFLYTALVVLKLTM